MIAISFILSQHPEAVLLVFLILMPCTKGDTKQLIILAKLRREQGNEECQHMAVCQGVPHAGSVMWEI